MEEAGVQIRMAVAEDVDQVRQAIQFTLANPEGRTLRKRYEDSIARSEMMVLSRYDNREHLSRVLGFIEWHSRVDGGVTIRDAGTIGDAPNLGTLKRLVRELLRSLIPASATVKVRADQEVWNAMFQETSGFILEGKEYTRPHWRQIWSWTMEQERAASRPTAQPRPSQLPQRRPR